MKQNQNNLLGYLGNNNGRKNKTNNDNSDTSFLFTNLLIYNKNNVLCTC